MNFVNLICCNCIYSNNINVIIKSSRVWKCLLCTMKAIQYSILSIPFGPTSFLSLHLCVCTPHRHTKRCTKLVSDARAGRSSWQMLHSGSLGVMHGTHVLITCCASLDTQSEEWQSSRLPHVCLFPHPHPHAVLPARFLFLLHSC